MKLTIERAVLFRALSHVQNVVERRNTIPILSNVLMRADDGKLSLTATDMDLEMVEAVTATVEREGATTAPAHTLFDIVRKLPDGAQVELEVAGDGSLLMIRAGRSSFRLGCLPTEDFPFMASGEIKAEFNLTAADLRTLIDRTRFAISTEETRYYLNGIYLHKAETDGADVLRAVATDGHRLARVEMPLPEGAAGLGEAEGDGQAGVIIPRKTVGEIRKLIDDADDDIKIGVSATKIRFSFGDAILTSKLIDGTFPDYQRVIPEGNDKTLAVDAKSFGSAVDRVATIATEKSRAVKLSLNASTLTLSATSPENGSASEEVEVTYDGGELEIGFNSKYLLDITGQIEGDGCQLIMADGASPTLIRDPSDPQSLYVLMPMRV
ncbi:MAG: DNA polymerase III subunit beta [Alphaproteobacteria bacterium]|nr:DNA polymerase III subunit beta [Alphaproteobacteria bacterium SS10]